MARQTKAQEPIVKPQMTEAELNAEMERIKQAAQERCKELILQAQMETGVRIVAQPNIKTKPALGEPLVIGASLVLKYDPSVREELKREAGAKEIAK